jgi:hypothetical protein
MARSTKPKKPRKRGGKLPALDGREAKAFLERFAPDHKVKSSIVSGVNTAGKPFVIHLEHGSGGMRPDVLSSALRYLGVSREAFWAARGRRG